MITILNQASCFRAMTPKQQVLFENTARNMGDSTLQIKHRHIYNCYMADPDYGKGVAAALGIDISTVDLDLPNRNSKESNNMANNKHPELDIPTNPVDSGKELIQMSINILNPKRIHGYYSTI